MPLITKLVQSFTYTAPPIAFSEAMWLSNVVSVSKDSANGQGHVTATIGSDVLAFSSLETQVTYTVVSNKTGYIIPDATMIPTTVAQYVADLRTQAGTSNSLCYVANYSQPLDGGGNSFLYDPGATEEDDGSLFIRPNSVAANAPGRWKLLVVGAFLSITAFGGVADCNSNNAGTDNVAAWKKADAAVKKYPQYMGVKFPAALRPDPRFGYLFRGPMPVRASRAVVGIEPGLSNVKVPLYFDNCKGVQLFHPANPGGGQEEINFQNFNIIGVHVDQFQEFIEGQDGLYFENKSILSNVSVTYFKGNGIRLNANVSGIQGPDGDIYYGTNANNWGMFNVVANANAGRGIYVTGGDANVGLTMNVNVTRNGMWGICDKSLLGCTWVNGQASDNANYGNSRATTPPVNAVTGSHVQVTQPDGIIYYFDCLQDHTNQPPMPGQTTAYWRGATYPQWQGATTYSEGAAVFYNGKLYTSRTASGAENKGYVPGAGDQIYGNSGIFFWNLITGIGNRQLVEYTEWNATDTYEHERYYSAWDDNINQDPRLGGPWTAHGTTDYSGRAWSWSPTRQFYGGGGYASLMPNAASVFVGCYVENGQVQNKFSDPTIVLGGFNDISFGSIRGTNNGNGLNLQQLYIQGGGTNGMQIRGTDGNGIYPLMREYAQGQLGAPQKLTNMPDILDHLMRTTEALLKKVG